MRCSSLFLVVAGCHPVVATPRYPRCVRPLRTPQDRRHLFDFSRQQRVLLSCWFWLGHFRLHEKVKSRTPVLAPTHRSTCHILLLYAYCGVVVTCFFLNYCPFACFHMPPITRSSSSKLAIAVLFLSPHDHAHSGFLTNHRAVRRYLQKKSPAWTNRHGQKAQTLTKCLVLARAKMENRKLPPLHQRFSFILSEVGLLPVSAHYCLC